MEEQNVPAREPHVVQLTLFPVVRFGRERRVTDGLRADASEDGRPRLFRLVAAWHDPRWTAERVMRSPSGARTTVFRRIAR